MVDVLILKKKKKIYIYIYKTFNPITINNYKFIHDFDSINVLFNSKTCYTIQYIFIGFEFWQNLYSNYIFFLYFLCLKFSINMSPNKCLHFKFLYFRTMLKTLIRFKLQIIHDWSIHIKDLKKIAFSNSKTYFINFNNSLYNSSHIKVSIFLPFHL